tara:strand:+ start:1386 stop:2165 length:780 start_codon:yes stop_codon:yes gene_type:complete
MYKNRFFLINKDLLSIILAVFLSVIIFFSNNSYIVKNIEKKIIDLSSYMLAPNKWYKNILVTRNENIELKQKIFQLNMLNAKLNNYKIENEKLRELLSFKESYKKISFMPANVMNHNFVTSPNSILVDVGSNDGVARNQSVLDVKGLIGKTIVTGKKSSKVHLISDKNFAVSVKIGENMDRAIFKPDLGKRGFLEGVIKSAKIKNGDIIYTSGLGEIYPPDIPVCKVISVNDDSDKPYLNVIVEILADLSNLNYVFIIQ